jgi:hypothetical protein
VPGFVRELCESDSPCWKASFQAKGIPNHNPIHRILSLHLASMVVAASTRCWSHRSCEWSLHGNVSGTPFVQRNNYWQVCHFMSLPTIVITIPFLIRCASWPMSETWGRHYKGAAVYSGSLIASISLFLARCSHRKPRICPWTAFPSAVKGNKIPRKLGYTEQCGHVSIRTESFFSSRFIFMMAGQLIVSWKRMHVPLTVCM